MARNGGRRLAWRTSGWVVVAWLAGAQLTGAPDAAADPATDAPEPREVAPRRSEGASSNGRFMIEESNDKFALMRSSDAQFTQGLAVRATWDPRWNDSPIARWFYEPFRRRLRPNRITVALELGQAIYTPDDISPFREDDELADGEAPLTPPQKQAEFDRWYADEFPGDRPYSSELYAEYRLTALFARPTLIDLVSPGRSRPGTARWTLAVRAGYVGPTFGGEVQKAVHGLMRDLSGETTPRTPQGWEFQQRQNGFTDIRDTEISPKLGVNATAEVEWDIVNTTVRGYPPHVRVSGLATMEVGMFRDLGGAGLRAEIGYLGKEPLACFPSGEHQQIPPACDNAAGPAVGGDVSFAALYLFAMGRGRLTVYNRHLDNHAFRDDPVQADRRWTDADLTLGLVARLWTFELEYDHTATIKATGQRDRGGLDHHVGTIKVSALF